MITRQYPIVTPWAVRHICLEHYEKSFINSCSTSDFLSVFKLTNIFHCERFSGLFLPSNYVNSPFCKLSVTRCTWASKRVMLLLRHALTLFMWKGLKGIHVTWTPKLKSDFFSCNCHFGVFFLPLHAWILLNRFAPIMIQIELNAQYQNDLKSNPAARRSRAVGGQNYRSA